jgi:DNA-binding Lrp family transcriptional regulator
VDSLEKAGVITRYTVLLDRAQAGFAMSAIVHVSLDRQ